MENVNEEVKSTEEEDEVIVPEELIPKEADITEENSKVEEKVEEVKEEDNKTVEKPESSKGNEHLQPKEVEGETSRERALRKEVERLRGLNRDKSKKDLVNHIHSDNNVKISEDRITRLKEIYSEEDLKNFEDVIDVLAEKKGYVKREHAVQDSANQTLDGFIDEHPEYSSENDKDDLRWNKFKSILLNDYNLKDKDTKQLKTIFAKVHRDVIEEFGETESKVNKRNAQELKVKSVSHAGGTKSEVKKPEKEIPAEVRNLFKGFEDGEL